MAASREEISSWFDRGLSQGASHMIVVCDMYDWEDYPVYVSGDFWSKHDEYNGKNAQKIMEVYDLSLNKQMQLNEYRANHSPPRKE